MNLSMVLTMAAAAHPERVAVVDSTKRLTYAELVDAARGFAAAVESEVSTVAAVGLTGCDTAVCLFGSAMAGRPYAPLNHRLPLEAIADLVDRLDSPLVVAGEGRTGTTVSELIGDGRIDPVDAPSGPAVLLYTSGTTAAPKAAVLGHDNLLSYLMNTLEFGDAEADEAALISVPPFHVAGVAAVLSSVWTGRRMVVLDRFTPEDWLRQVREEHITHAFVVPTMLARIVETAEGDRLDVPTLRSLAYGGARTPRPILERALRALRDVSMVNAYGLTETSSTIAVLSPEDHRAAQAGDEDAIRRLESVGRPVPGIEVEILDDDANILGRGAVGRVRIRGEQVSGRYLDIDGGEPGTLTTEDLGYVDDGGYLFLLGRADDVIIRGGENISPAAIEDALLEHPAVAQAVVVGVPDDEWGEAIAAAIVVRGPLEVAGLLEHVRGVVGGLRCPQRVVVLDELPLTPTGKVIRRAARELVMDRVAADVE